MDTRITEAELQTINPLQFHEFGAAEVGEHHTYVPVYELAVLAKMYDRDVPAEVTLHRRLIIEVDGQVDDECENRLRLQIQRLLEAAGASPSPLLSAYRASVVDCLEKGSALVSATAEGPTAVIGAHRAAMESAARRDELDRKLSGNS